jgi:hypothetical protein
MSKRLSAPNRSERVERLDQGQETKGPRNVGVWAGRASTVWARGVRDQTSELMMARTAPSRGGSDSHAKKAPIAGPERTWGSEWVELVRNERLVRTQPQTQM